MISLSTLPSLSHILSCTDRSGISTKLNYYYDLFDLVYTAQHAAHIADNVVIAGQLAGLWQRVGFIVMMCPVVIDCNINIKSGKSAGVLTGSHGTMVDCGW